MLNSVPLHELGEVWPFYLEAIQRALLANGRLAESTKQLGVFEQLPLPQVEGNGQSGSVLPIAAAFNALVRRDVVQARHSIDRADSTIAVTAVLKAVCELAAGNPQDSLRLVHDLGEQTQGLRKLDLWRIAVAAASNLVLGEEDACVVIIAKALNELGQIGPEEVGYFSAEVRSLAEARFPEWPRTTEPSSQLFNLMQSGAVVLTERELESLSMLFRGLSREQIARQQFISLNTLKGHLRSLYRKLEVGSRAAAVTEGLRRGLI